MGAYSWYDRVAKGRKRLWLNHAEDAFQKFAESQNAEIRITSKIVSIFAERGKYVSKERRMERVEFKV